MNFSKKLFVILFFIFLLTGAYSQETDSESIDASFDEDSFFNDDDIVITPDEAETDISLTSIQIKDSKITFGGYINSGLRFDATWFDPYTKKENHKHYFTHPDSGLTTILGADLFFNVRPKENTRFYGKFKFAYPFVKTFYGYTPIYDSSNKFSHYETTVTPNVPYFKIFELFADFQIRNTAFFRFGKHTVKWGTGYFYSPADIINLTDPNRVDLTYEQEGPVSLRCYTILPNVPHTLWFYILPDINGDFKKTAIATKAEFIAGSWEFGLGARYKYKTAPRAVFTFDGKIGKLLSVFGELTFSWGSDYTYHKVNSAFAVDKLTDRPFAQATAGLAYFLQKTKTDFAFQYYYNGFGYLPSEMTAINKKLKDNDALAQYIDNNLFAMQHDKTGQHYIAISINQYSLGTDILSASFFTEFDVSSLSALTDILLHCEITDDLNISTGTRFVYPLSKKSEAESSVNFNLYLKLGGGKF